MADKRKSPRVHSLNFVAEEGLMHRTLDVSREGMMLEMLVPPPLGTRMNLTVAFGESVVTFPAQVMRHELIQGNRVGVGLRFENLPPEARAAIEAHLAERAGAR